jgi:outer membrane protein OmpA-like peptidoglycan-associated protein
VFINFVSKNPINKTIEKEKLQYNMIIKIQQIILVSTIILMQNICVAQKKSNLHQRWEGGILVGVSQYQGDIKMNGTEDVNTAVGILLRRHLTDNFALRGNYITSSFSASDSKKAASSLHGFKYSSQTQELSLVFEYDMFGKLRYRKNKFHPTFSTYIYGGIANIWLQNQSTTFSNINNENGLLTKFQADQIQNKKSSFHSIPIGLGIKMDLSEQVGFNIEAGKRVMFSDYLDGISKSGNPNDNDAYYVATAILTYRFEYRKDSDKDGVFDDMDACPNVPGSPITYGCPDQDEDGVSDKRDLCPTIAGKKSLQGCPDTDNDDVADKDDDCPTIAGLSTLKGCPDTDNDGVADKDDECPSVAGDINYNGCPTKDSDEDGIDDHNDKCPNEKGLASLKGCPSDKDEDGVPDYKDKCPNEAGGISTAGCPDFDKDGVYNSVDKCPNVTGTIANNGCPEITSEERSLLQKALYDVQFEGGKSTFKKATYPVLEQILNILYKYPAYKLAISGHTDNGGDKRFNLTLSENRAKACYNYFVKKGIDVRRLNAAGYGSDQPIEDNSTYQGRIKNRRVDFSLYL